MELYVDGSYRTSLGVGFYNRYRELQALDRYLKAHRTLIVYGPRNVGKSELMSYWIKKNSGGGFFLVVDAREKRVDSLGFNADKLKADFQRFREELTGIVKTHLEKKSSLIGMLLEIIDMVRDVIRQYLSKELIVFVDEFHLMPGYFGGAGSSRELMKDLEAVAGLLAKRSDINARFIATISEGFLVMDHELRSRLVGYSTGYFLVEEMDGAHFKALFDEYSGRWGCSVGYSGFISIVGGVPGYLRDICPRSRDDLKTYILNMVGDFEYAISVIGKRMGIGSRRVIEMIYRLFVDGYPAQRDPDLYDAGRMLVERNIAYIKYTDRGVVFRPQINLYRKIVELAYREGADSLMDLSSRIDFL